MSNVVCLVTKDAKIDAINQPLFEEFIQQNDLIIIVGYNNETNQTDVCCNMNWGNDRLTIKGMMDDAMEIIRILSKPR
jgi:hypothetical protein